MREQRADDAYAQAQELRDTGQFAAAYAAARRALEIDPMHAPALELLATGLVTRRRQYVDGLAYIDRAAAASPKDPGVWYARGWCYEFAAHEIKRRPNSKEPASLDPRALYQVAAESFRRCLALHPEGKLLDDANDLLDHVENELSA